MKTLALKEKATPSTSSQASFNKKGEGSFLSSTNKVEHPFSSPNPGIQRNPIGSSFSGGHNIANIPIFSPRSQPVIQPKLTINEPGDKYEQEADAMAEQVMRMTSVLPGGDRPQTGLSTVPSLQRKCAACEEEEKIQREEIGEKELLQTKPLMRKAVGGGYTATHQLQSQLNSSKGGGNPLPGPTLSSMSQAFGADFSKVRVHTGTQAAELSQGIQAKAFTHGGDIYFNQGQYNPETGEGKRLLGHELTHVVQQGVTMQRQSLARQLSHTIDDQPDIQTALFDIDISTRPDPDKEAKKKRYESYGGNVVDIAGQNMFNPDVGLGNYVASHWEDGQYRVLVNIKFGSLASGHIWVEQTGSYYALSCTSIPLNPLNRLNPLSPVPDISVGSCKDSPPNSNNYNAPQQVIPFEHPDLDTSGKNGTLVLIVGIESGVISGKLGWLEGKTKDNIKPLEDVSSALTNLNDFIPFIFGEEHKERVFIPDSAFVNQLANGILTFQLGGDLQIDHLQKIHASFALLYDLSLWEGSLKTDIQGADAYELKMERTPQGYISGEANDMNVNGEWQGQGFTVSGGLSISYVNANLAINGNAKYHSNRADGEVSIAVTDKPTAEQLFLRNLPAQAAAQGASADEFLDSYLPDPTQPLALTAWGNLHLKILENANNLEGDVSFAVHPDGHIITAGQVKFRPDFVLLKKKKDFKNLIEEEIGKWFSVPPIPIPVYLYANGKFDIGYEFGNFELEDVKFAEILASGFYSNHPSFRSELKLSATVDMAADLWAKCRLEAGGMAGVPGVANVEGKGIVSGEAHLLVHVRATPSIAIEGGIDPGGSAPKYIIGGKLYVGGQVQAALVADVEISYELLKVKRSGRFRLVDVKWTIGGFSVAISAGYVLGSAQPPEFSISNDDLVAAEFLAALLEGRARAAKGKKMEGGFKEEGSDKGQGQAQDKPLDTLHPDDEPLWNPLVDTFRMGGKAHTLFLTVSGSRGNPEVRLEMQSNRENLVEKIEEEQLMIRHLLLTRTFSEKEEKKLYQALNDLERMKEEAANTIKSATVLSGDQQTSKEDVEHLGDSIANYGNRFQKSDLGVPDAAPVYGPTRMEKPSGNPAFDWQKIENGELLDLTDYLNHVSKQQMRIRLNFVSVNDKKKRTNKVRCKQGLSPYLDDNTKVELHHKTQNFFSELQEVSSSHHKLDYDDLHEMAGDPGYISWRGEIALYNGKVKTLGEIFDNIRKKYWRNRF